MTLSRLTLSSDLFPGQPWFLDGHSPPVPAADPLAQAMVNPTSALRHALTRFAHPRVADWEHYTPWSGIPGEWGNPDVPARPLLPLPHPHDGLHYRLFATRQLHWSRTFGWRLAALISYVRCATFAGSWETPWTLNFKGGQARRLRVEIVNHPVLTLDAEDPVWPSPRVPVDSWAADFRCYLPDGGVLTIPVWWLYANPDDVQRIAVESRRRRLLAEGVDPAPAPGLVSAELNKRADDAWMALGLREYNARLRAGWLAATADVDAWLTRVRGHLLERGCSVFHDALMDAAGQVTP